MNRSFSSVNCIIFINTNRVDDFYSIEYTRSESVMPIYSWRSKRFQDLAQGQILVSGNLILNINRANQLLKILHPDYVPENTSETDSEIENSLQIAKELLEGKLDQITIGVNDDNSFAGRRAELGLDLTSTLDAEAVDARSRLNESAIELARLRRRYIETHSISTKGTDVSVEIERAIADHELIFNKTYSIEIQNNRNGEVELIDQVRFSGRANQIQAGSSQNIKYAFPFIAREALSRS